MSAPSVFGIRKSLVGLLFDDTTEVAIRRIQIKKPRETRVGVGRYAHSLPLTSGIDYLCVRVAMPCNNIDCFIRFDCELRHLLRYVGGSNKLTRVVVDDDLLPI